MKRAAVVIATAILAMSVTGISATETGRRFDLAAAPQSETKSDEARNKDEASPEQTMARRFPQPIRVGDLIGLPVLDWWDSTIGFIEQVVRTPDGKIQLIVPYGRWLGWAPFAKTTTWGKRPVAVPIEKVAILGRQVAALDMSRDDFDTAPTWTVSQGEPIAPSEMIRIAITRR